MSIAILNELYTELRRLTIAGSMVAPGDYRLKKLIEPLQKAGAKAPVFSKLAESVEELVHSNEQNSASNLLNLSTLVCSVLYTQGTVGANGTLEPIPPNAVSVRQTPTSARTLKPLIQALTTSGSGRLDEIRGAVDRGLFADLRLVRPALAAIDDSYSEIGELIAERVLPMYGKAILGELKSSFDIKGKAGHARRLKLMHKIDPAFARDIVKESIANGSPELKVAAIECLGDQDEDVSYLIDQSRAAAKDVRQAAYHALCKLTRDDCMAVLIRGIDGKDLELVANASRDTKPPQLLHAVLERLSKLIEELLATQDKNRQGEMVSRGVELISILCNAMSSEGRTFLQRCIENSAKLLKIKSTPGGMDLVASAVQALTTDRASHQYLIQERDALPAECFRDVLSMAFGAMPPNAFYETFSPYLHGSPKKNSSEHRKQDMIRKALMGEHRAPWNWSRTQDRPPMDVAWLEDAIAADDLELALALAQPDHVGLNAFIDAKLANPKETAKLEVEIASAMIAIHHPRANEFVLDKLTASSKKKGGYDFYGWCHLASQLSPDALPSLESLASDPKLGESAINRLIGAIHEIRERTTKSN